MILETRHSIPEILSHQVLFRALNQGELARIGAGTYEYRVARNEMLFRKGDPPVGMHVVISGQVKLFLPSPAGSEKIVSLAGHGDSFGEEGVFIDRSQPMAAQATRDSLLLVVDKRVLLDATAANHALAAALMARLCSRMCSLIDNVETCVQRSSAQRVAHYLAQQGPQEAESFDLCLESNKQDIASQLNLAPETFSRVLGRLARDGYIGIKGSCITVLNLPTLRSFAG